MRIATCTLALIFPGIAGALEFFCPRADLDVSLTQGGNANSKKDVVLQSGPGLPLSFPQNADVIERASGDVSVLSIRLTDCSSAKFFCKSVSHHYGDGAPVQYLLVVPRSIKPGEELEHRGVRMLTRLTTNTFRSRDATAQVTTWQSIEGKQTPFEFTVQVNRGLLYWDGFVFDFRDNRPPQMCVFGETDSLFASVRVRKR